MKYQTRIFSVLPLRDIVVFPGMIAPLFVGREKSISALEDVIKQDKKILLVTQKEICNSLAQFARHGCGEREMNAEIV